jgi:hypothetical protein
VGSQVDVPSLWRLCVATSRRVAAAKYWIGATAGQDGVVAPTHSERLHQAVKHELRWELVWREWVLCQSAINDPNEDQATASDPHSGDRTTPAFNCRAAALTDGVGLYDRISAATILVVEDDPAMSGTLLQALEARGYRVLFAATCGDARALFGEVQPDLIILNLMVPDADGPSLTASFRTLTSASTVVRSAHTTRLTT